MFSGAQKLIFVLFFSVKLENGHAVRPKSIVSNEKKNKKKYHNATPEVCFLMNQSVEILVNNALQFIMQNLKIFTSFRGGPEGRLSQTLSCQCQLLTYHRNGSKEGTKSLYTFCCCYYRVCRRTELR